MAENYGSLPFLEAIQFFRNKLNMPTERWDDLWQDQHALGFMIAGATKSDILSDFRTAVDKAIADGVTLADFRKEFDAIVKKYGWQYNGGRGWRSRVIYDTNMRQAYNAGRWAQFQVNRERRPYLMYKHGGSADPRPLHLEWDGIVLHIDNPWWDQHMPQNGWGCSCKVFALSEKDVQRKGLKITEKMDDHGHYDWTNKRTGEVISLPNGVDPGFAYNVGKAATGTAVEKSILDEQRGGKWFSLGGRDHVYYSRPDTVPVDEARAGIGEKAESTQELQLLLDAALKSKGNILTDPFGDQLVITEGIIRHISEATKRLDGREQFFTLIPEMVEDPYEIWVSFAKNELTGKVGVRKTYLKVVKVDKVRTITLLAETLNGVWVDFDIFRGSKTYAKKLRRGHLIWGREENGGV